MQDGRASRPPLPEAFLDIAITRGVNETLGTHYSPEEIDAMPQIWIEKVLMYRAHAGTNG